MKTYHRVIIASTSLFLLSACAETAERLSRVGKGPELAPVQNPQERADYKPVTWPMPKEPVSGSGNPNSLWQPGAKAFFKDQRARRVGDILTVKVTIDDKAELDNTTDVTRNNSESLGVPSMFGLQKPIANLLPSNTDPANLVSMSGDKRNRGGGTIDRKEKIETEVAAIVTQILPNGNMVVEGKQQIRVNSEVRELYITGVLRPEDIQSNNTVDSSQIAEARISYGGKGTISDVQRPRYGAEVLDIISPF